MAAVEDQAGTSQCQSSQAGSEVTWGECQEKACNTWYEGASCLTHGGHKGKTHLVGRKGTGSTKMTELATSSDYCGRKAGSE